MAVLTRLAQSERNPLSQQPPRTGTELAGNCSFPSCSSALALPPCPKAPPPGCPALGRGNPGRGGANSVLTERARDRGRVPRGPPRSGSRRPPPPRGPRRERASRARLATGRTELPRRPGRTASRLRKSPGRDRLRVMREAGSGRGGEEGGSVRARRA